MTLKNAGLAGGAFIVLLLLLSLWSEFRPHSDGSGSLFESHVKLQPSGSPTAHRELTIVDEGPSDGLSRADSFLLDPAAQDQLQAAAAGLAAEAPSTAVEPSNFEHRTSQLGMGQRITISGGSEGVEIHAEPIPRPASTQTSGTAAPARPIGTSTAAAVIGQ